MAVDRLAKVGDRVSHLDDTAARSSEGEVRHLILPRHFLSRTMVALPGKAMKSPRFTG